MKRGHNTVHIACLLELHNAIKKFAGESEQNEGFWFAKRGLACIPELRNFIIEKCGQEKYEEIVRHYSKTNIQQRAERKLEEEKRRIREEARLKIEQLKTEAYAQQTNLANKKQEKKERKKNLPRITELKQELKREQNALEANQKWLENKDFSTIPEKQVRENIKTLSERISGIKRELKELGDSA